MRRFPPSVQPPRMQRLLRVVLACWALLLVFEPPVAATASGELRTLSAWLSPAQAPSRAGSGSRSSGSTSSGSTSSRSTGVAVAAAAPREASAGSIEQRSIEALSILQPSIEPRSILQRLEPGVGGAASSHLGGRYLYLEYQSLLC